MKKDFVEIILQAIAFALSICAFITLIIAKHPNTTEVLKILSIAVILSNFIGLRKISSRK